MRSLYSRTALIVALSYAVLIASVLIYGWHTSDNEGRIWVFLIYELPWSLVFAAVSTANEIVIRSLDFVVFCLDIVTVYICALSLVKIFGNHSD